MNRYAAWKYVLITVLVIVGCLYALPNIYGNEPALQITSSRGAESGTLTELAVGAALDEAGIEPRSMQAQETGLLVRFANEEDQLRAQNAIKDTLGQDYVVALNLAAATPDWLRALGAEPMFLGLDLRGGVHFLMEVNMRAAIAKAEERYISDFRTLLRENKIRYRTITRYDDSGVLVQKETGADGVNNLSATEVKDRGILIRYKDAEQQRAGDKLIEDTYFDLTLSVEEDSAEPVTRARLTEQALQETREQALQQNITTLRKRVNELGVAEPVIQRQGANRIVVQLPGVQDTARAKDILGATATLEFRMVDDTNSIQDALDGRTPIGSRLYKMRDGSPILLKKQVMLTGEYIIDAASGFDQISGGPDVSITLDGRGARIFSRATADEVGKRMAVVYIETKTQTITRPDGTREKRTETIEEVINAATIQEQLGKRFHITGLDSTEEARTLALLLRAGALAAPLEIIEERTVGPSLGQDNIEQGFESVLIGFLLVLVFMAIYYRVFGLFAGVALTLNLVFIVALLSMLQATLTLPGIAGIVLTVGMAVDANVLIFERIREEIRNGNSPQASIHAGYEKAFSSIADANITTLIAALVLFSFGTGPIKGFAVTLSLGIICSMFTAIMVTRALVNLTYGGKKLQKLSI
ncbi:MAG: protein translocase subunit SecD [Gammaproteobacteria bacterium]|nr:protein translocase subunit SecD [Gammaproteobacteria bacterium]